MPLSIARRRAALSAIPLAVLACTDGPSAPRATTRLRVCVDAPLIAYRNEGGRWTRLRMTAGAYWVDATARFALAHAFESWPHLHVEYTTPEQVRETYPCSVPAPSTSTPVTAVVRPYTGAEEVVFTYGEFQWALWGAYPIAGLPGLDGSRDLVVVRNPQRLAWWRSDRVIVRRAPSYDGSSNVVFDFDSDEAFAPELRSLRFDGARTRVYVGFQTTGGVAAPVHGSIVGEVGDAVVPRSVPIAALPAARTVPGDLHEMQLGDIATGDERRTVTLWTRDPRDVAMRFGPIASAPAFTAVATSPHMRIVALVPSHADYDATVWLNYHQAAPDRRSITIRATREHFGGTPQPWRLEMPDLSRVDGFARSNPGLRPGSFSWHLTVSSQAGFPRHFLKRHEGQVVRSAVASGTAP